jgi:hypothetical protein
VGAGAPAAGRSTEEAARATEVPARVAEVPARSAEASGSATVATSAVASAPVEPSRKRKLKDRYGEPERGGVNGSR